MQTSSSCASFKLLPFPCRKFSFDKFKSRFKICSPFSPSASISLALQLSSSFSHSLPLRSFSSSSLATIPDKSSLEISSSHSLSLPDDSNQLIEFSQECSNHNFTLAGEMYRECITSENTRVDLVFSQWMKDVRLADRKVREFVVPLVQKLLRSRSYLDAVCSLLPEKLPSGAYPSILLLRDHNFHYSMLPVDIRLGVLLKRAVAHMEQAPLEIRASLPPFLCRRFVEERGKEEATALSFAFQEAPPLTLRANTLKTTVKELMARLKKESHIRTKRTKYSPVGLTLCSYANVFRTGAFFDGWFEVQDEASQIVTLLGEVQGSRVVVDACAGRGGKTLHLSALMEKKGILYALDSNASHLNQLQRRAQRAGAKAKTLVVGEDDESTLSGAADVVLVDAPCSGLGVLRRHPEVGWRQLDIDELQRTQREILAKSATFVRPGGRLVYATCSVLREENDDVVDDFLRNHPNFSSLSAKELLLKQCLPNDLPFAGERLYLDPLRHGTDGFFAAVLLRQR